MTNLLAKRPTGENVFRRAGDQVFCTACSSNLAPRKSVLDLHLKTKIHQENATKHLRQSQLRNTDELSNIGLELVEAFLAANIALHKLSNPKLRSFLDKYLPYHIVSISTMRNKYIDRLYNILLAKIKDDLRGNLVQPQNLHNFIAFVFNR